MSSLHALIRQRELTSLSCYRQTHGHVSLARRLSAGPVLGRHDGCVNRLCFSSDSKILASASDDASICLWSTAVDTHYRDPSASSLITRVQTPHSNNILGLRFIPHSANGALATGAMDNAVMVTDVEREAQTFTSNRHTDHVRTVDVHPTSPHALYSASDDCTVHLSDLRAGPAEKQAPIIRLPRPARSMENPGVSSALVSPCGARLIVGSDAVRIFDVRKLQAAGGSAARPDEALLTFLPTHLAGSAVENSMRLAGGGLEPIVTYAAFSDCGAWVVANFQSDAAYVFDVRHGSEGMSGGTRCAAASGGMAGASRRREALLRDAVRGMVEKQYCTALARLNELITLPGGDDLRARHLRCECLLRRAWLSDSRAALRDAKFCAAAVAAGPGALEGLLPAALEDQKVASALCGAWKVVFDLQRAKAILGMVVPWGTLFPEWGRCDFEDHRDAFLKIMTTVKRLDYIGDLLDTLLEQVRILEGESKLTLSALGALPSASHGCLVPCAPFFCGVAPRLVLMRDCVEDSKKKLAGLIACALDVSDDNDEDGDTIWLAEICEELHDSLGRPVLAPAFWDSNVRCGYRNRLCGHQNLYTSIKEANFYGAGAQCVMSGSDDGFLYVWDARTGDILSRLRADDDIVNCCIQAPGGFDGGLVATSGLSHSVKLWYATGDGRSLDADASFRSDCEEAFEVNQITTKGHVSSPELR